MSTPSNLAFIAYEAPYAPCAGITAVMRFLPKAVKTVSGIRTVVVTPYHHRVITEWAENTAPGKPRSHADALRWLSAHFPSVAKTTVRFKGTPVDVSVRRLAEFEGIDWSNGMEWYALESHDEQVFSDPKDRFFSGDPHPYLTPWLVRDSLFFGACVARALQEIGNGGPWTLFMQDWESVTAALALAKESPDRVQRVLTLHNSYDSYDSGGIDPQWLTDVDIDITACRGPKGEPRPTVLQRALPLVEHTVFTVSEQFASDFSEESLIADVMGKHLRESLKGRIIGVDNGLFETNLRVDSDTLLKVGNGDYHALMEWKSEQRARFLRALDAHVPVPDKPVWGDRAAFRRISDTGSPWFAIAGRDDPRQRGHDVAAEAMDQFLEAKGNAQFLFFPMPGDESLPGLQFLQELATRRPGNVLVLPFFFREGYKAALSASAFGIMPSLYEPFGSANEIYLCGALGMARATGGLIEQIVPLRAAASYSRAVHGRVCPRWHPFASRPTGILYREPDQAGTVDSWENINRCAYDPTGADLERDRVRQRKLIPVFAAMARELRAAIEDGIRVHEDGRLYCEMLLEGISYLRRTFSWERAAREYLRVLR